MPELQLDWRQDGDDYYADTPFGRAVITEVRSTDRWNVNSVRYAAYIRQTDGTKISIPRLQDSFEAVKWMLIKRLQTLAKEPEEEFDELFSTLEICREFLTIEGEPEQLDHIDRIEIILRKHYGIEI